MRTYTQPICEVIGGSFLVNNGAPHYGDNTGATGLVTSGNGISATMAQTNEDTSFDGEENITKHPSLWDE